MESTNTMQHHEAWNKGKLVGQKAPFKLKEIWAIRVRLQMQGRLRELALFDLGIDSKLRACDLVKLRVRDVCHGELDHADIGGKCKVGLPSTERRPSWNHPIPLNDARLGTRASWSARRRHSNSRRSGPFGFVCRCKGGSESWRSSTWVSTANCAPAI